jgi:hypothetical protein
MRKIDGIVLLIIIFLITCELFNGYDWQYWVIAILMGIYSKENRNGI